jgi:hypothetical protein
VVRRPRTARRVARQYRRVRHRLPGMLRDLAASGRAVSSRTDQLIDTSIAGLRGFVRSYLPPGATDSSALFCVDVLEREVQRLRAALAARPDDLAAAVAVVKQDHYGAREMGLRVLGDEQCCELACNGGGCESCPCCWAGYCVSGSDGQIPDTTDPNFATWLEVAAEYNPVAKALLAARPDPIGYALAVPSRWGIVLAPYGYRTLDNADDARIEIRPDMDWQVCALTPVDGGA